MYKLTIALVLLCMPLMSICQIFPNTRDSTKVHFAYLNDCNEFIDSCLKKHFYFHIEVSENEENENPISYIKMRPNWQNAEEGSEGSTQDQSEYIIRRGYNGFEIELYRQCVNENILNFTLEGYTSNGEKKFSDDHEITIESEREQESEEEEKIEVSSHMDSLLGVWQKSDSSMVTFFCNKQISQIELLSFFRDYMGLTKEEMCQFLIEYNIQTQLEVDKNVVYIWRNNLCILFEEFYKELGGGEEDDLCNCRMITTNRSALNGGTSSLQVNDNEDQCYDYEPWVRARNYELNDDDDDWIVSYGRLGAFKGVGFLADYDGGDDSPNEFVVERSGWSNISFRSVCSDPVTITPNLDNCISCTKEIELKYYYKTQGFVYGETSYHIDGAKLGMRLEDWAMVTVQNHDQITVEDLAGRAYTMNCEAPGQSITDVLTSVSSLIDPISTVLDTSQSSGTQIGAAIQAAGIVVGLIETNITAQACQAVYDSDTIMLSGTNKYDLLPGQFFQAIMTSGWAASGKAENNGRGRIILNSDGYMAAVVNTVPNDDGEVPKYCECEKMASYVLGSMERYEPASVNLWNNNPFTGPSMIFDYFPDGNFNLKRYVGQFIGSHGPWPGKWEQSGCCSDVEIQCQSECAYISGCDVILPNTSPNIGFRNSNSIQGWKAVPNPAAQFFELVNSNGILNDDLYEMSIFDMAGKIVKVSKEGVNRFDTSLLQSGVYIIKVLDKVNGETSFIKLIKTE